MPIFIRIEKHREITANMNSIKAKIATARETLEKIKEIKQREDTEITEWQARIDNVEEKLRFFEEAMRQE